MSTALVVAEVLGCILGYMIVGVVVAAVLEHKFYVREKDACYAAGALWPFMPIFLVLLVVSAGIMVCAAQMHGWLAGWLTRPKKAKLPKARARKAE